jgi:hypothetical protein
MVFLGVALYVFSGWNPDVRFESSDAIWHDNTNHFKGRNLTTILFDFDEYRIKCHRQDVTLVRTTRMSTWNVVSWIWYVIDPEWRVPWSAQRTCLTHRCVFAGFPECTGADKLPGILPPDRN